MGTKITTLVENTVTASPFPLLAEHGLSFLIERDGRRILFDAGQGLAILNNAGSLGIDLSTIDTVVLSHGHYDHTRGLPKLLEKARGFRLIAHENVFDEKLVCLGQNCFPIGMGNVRSDLEAAGVEMVIANAPVEIAPGVMTTGQIPMKSSFEVVEPMFFIEENGERRPDTLPDDNALIVDTPKGIVVVFGCAHRGAVNTLLHVNELTGKKKIHAIMGGLHLFLADRAKLDTVCEALAEFDIDRFIVGHCTGFAATAALHRKFGDKVTPNLVGFTLIL